MQDEKTLDDKIFYLMRVLSVGPEKAILEKEAEGHKKVAGYDRLPIDLNGTPAEHFVQLGFVLGERLNAHFLKAEFPKGWSVQPTSHPMWSDILDEKGFIRGAIFYKSSFYDEKAHTNLHCRVVYRPEWDENSDFKGYEVFCKMPNKQEKRLAFFDKSEGENSSKSGEGLANTKKYLEENYPEYTNPCAYWDLDL